jgi:hypothetical protein
MLNSAQLTISGQPASSSETARQWLVKFAEICQRDVSPALVGIWAEQLGDIPADLLNRACDRLAKTWTSGFLPTPGNVQAQIENANSWGLELEAAEAWERWLALIQKFFHPDLGWDRRAPRVDAITEYAGRAAGGALWVESCPESELQWCRKRFLDAYKLAQETGKVQHLLTRDGAKSILGSLAAVAPTKQPPQRVRPAATPKPVSSEPDRETLRALNDTFEKINAQQPTLAPLSEAEWERRKAHLKAQAERLKRQHPEWYPATT